MKIKTILIFSVLIVSVLSDNINLSPRRKLTPRISGGKYAKDHQFPYQAALKIFLSAASSQSDYFCGGSLISPEYVLTAAHCLCGENYEMYLGFPFVEKSVFKKYEKAIVILGTNKLSDKQQEGQQTFNTSKKNFKIHENYDPSSEKVVNDIALINLPQPAKINEFVKVVNLPSKSIGDIVGKSFIASGWGLTGDGLFSIFSPPKKLRYVKLKIMQKSVCGLYFQNYTNHKYHICAEGYYDKSTCVGDSGGPNVIEEEDGTYTQIGIVSFGSGRGCQIGWPSVATRVSTYLDWISDNTGIEVNN